MLESGGKRCRSAADGILDFWPAPPFWLAGVVTWADGGGSSARALPITPQANRISAREVRRGAASFIEFLLSRRLLREARLSKRL
ncbi:MULTISPECIES: hypothetical protein [Bradyrhizobium]|uniref:hypothetical protein n=1 Tax=Bradyrhizobium pachyrhizi TaxID=280333 RepID=UPI002AA573C2